jgi:protein-disulfide isomerase
MRELVLTAASAAAALLAAAAPCTAQTPVCDVLGGGARDLARRVLASEHPYECCDDTIARCLEAVPPAPLAIRLADDVCRRAAAGQDETRIRRALSRRARSMVGGGEPARVTIDEAAAAGPPGAPVTVAVYACARCPYCSRLVPELYREVTVGDLAGSARLVFRTFPIRGHEGSTEAGLAFVAAAAMSRFWEFALYAYARFDEFAPAAQTQWAAAIGLDPGAFADRQADPATREALVESKKEGLANGVEETPTVFINGRRWVGDLDAGVLADAIAEEAGRIREELCAAH